MFNCILQGLLYRPFAIQASTNYIDQDIHVGVMKDGLVHLHKKGEPSSNPVVVLFADGNIDYFLSAVRFFLLFFEGDKFEDERNGLSWMKEECIVLSDHVVSFWFTVSTNLYQKYC